MKTRRLLAAFIASAMVLGSISIPAFAEGEAQVPTDEAVIELQDVEETNAPTAAPVAKIGDAGYPTLAEAIGAAGDGDTINLLTDFTDMGTVVVPAGVTIDGTKANGEKAVITGNSSFYYQPGGGALTNVKMSYIHNEGGDLSAVYGHGLSGTLTITDCEFGDADWDVIQITPVKGANISITQNIFGRKNEATALHHTRFVHIQSSYKVDFSATVTQNKMYNTSKLDDTAVEVYYFTDQNKIKVDENYIESPKMSCILKNYGTNVSEMVFPLYTDDTMTETYTPGIYAKDNYELTVHDTITDALNSTLLTGSDVYVYLNNDIKEDVVKNSSNPRDLYLNGHTITNVSGHTIANNKGSLYIYGPGTVDNVSHGKAALYNAPKATCYLNSTYITDKDTITFKRSMEAGVDANNNGGNSYYTIQNQGKMYVRNYVTVENSGKYSSCFTTGFQDGTKAPENYTSALTISGNNTLVSGGINAIKVDECGSLSISGGRFENSAQFAVQNWNIANISGGTFVTDNSSVLYNGVWNDYSKGHLTISGGTFTAPADTNIICKDNYSETATTDITGGVFSNYDIDEYLKDGKRAVLGDDGMYTIGDADVKVINTATSTGTSVEMEGLYTNLKNNSEEFDSTDKNAVFKVKLDEAPVADVAKAPSQTTDTRQCFDISVVKVENGAETPVKVEGQNVIINLGKKIKTSQSVKVYHITDTGYEEVPITGWWTDDKDKIYQISFNAPSFSTYVIDYNAADLSAEDITENVTVEFKKTTDSEYDIVLKADSGKAINRLTSADLTFKNTNANVSYTIKPAAYVNITQEVLGSDRYMFNFNGKDYSDATGSEITIGTVTFEGIGSGCFNVDSAAETNEVHPTKLADNIVETYVPVGSLTQGTGTLILPEDTTDPSDPKGDIQYDLGLTHHTVKVNVQFPNNADEQGKDYNDMKVKFDGSLIGSGIEVELGNNVNGKTVENAAGEIKISEVTYYPATATEPAYYGFTIDLPQDKYVLSFSGAGYRTYRKDIMVDKDTYVTVWNNVMDDEHPIVETIDGVGAPKKIFGKNGATFLAGEIVKDNNINIYDLSAVVSYFGQSHETNSVWDYAKYDLNRDGKIDSKDVAYVLVSWGN